MSAPKQPLPAVKSFTDYTVGGTEKLTLGAIADSIEEFGGSLRDALNPNILATIKSEDDRENYIDDLSYGAKGFCKYFAEKLRFEFELEDKNDE
ncbi:MAG: hypothetical protein COB08_011065 [Rhodobacteraceae bacterium]|nr:hypothetical protein [Paracoccaceae bacterium]